MIDFCKRLAKSRWFNNTVIIAILLAGVVVGIETYGQQVAKWLPVLHLLDWIILWIFTVEAVVKITALGKGYFTDSWNLFDFIIVIVCWGTIFIPSVDAGFVVAFRLARILRVLRLVNALPQLKLLVDAMLKSIPSMGYVGILLFLLFYIYGVIGVFIFGNNDPLHFGNLQTSLITLFQITTLEGWADIMFINVNGCDDPVYGVAEGCENPRAMGMWALLYFISFVLFGTMIVLNLFIGVIMNSMDEVRNEQMLEMRLKKHDGQAPNVEVEIASVQHQIDQIKEQLDFIAFRLREK